MPCTVSEKDRDAVGVRPKEDEVGMAVIVDVGGVEDAYLREYLQGTNLIGAEGRLESPVAVAEEGTQNTLRVGADEVGLVVAVHVNDGAVGDGIGGKRDWCERLVRASGLREQDVDGGGRAR